MQFSTVAATLFTLLPLALAAPAAAAVCSNGAASYDACVADVFCVASWPESCICINKARTDCAAFCNASDPDLDNCDATKNKRTAVPAEADCLNDCLSGLACIQSWPESCICANKNKQDCAATCGVAVPTLQDCS